MKSRLNIRATILISMLLLVAATLFFRNLSLILDHNLPYTAYIYHNGTLIQTIPLSKISDSQQVLIGDLTSDYNRIEVVPGSIRILEASCPDQICVNQGYISNSLIPITCLPNHLVIELKADTVVQNNSTDAVSH